MRKGGVVTARRRTRERNKANRRRAMTVGVILLLCAMAMSQQLKVRLLMIMEEGLGAVQTFAGQKSETSEIMLEEMALYALQLGVFDNGDSAQKEQQRFAEAGVPCVIWQRDKMRLIADVSDEREKLNLGAAGGNDAYVVRDTLQEVRLRLSCAVGESETAAALVQLPDQILKELISGKSFAPEALVTKTRWRAEKAIADHPENALFVQLAQSLLEWCRIMEDASDQPHLRCYAAVTMCTICREWRNALLDYTPSAQSTASAQRTPSTAADVMPPA